MECVRTTVGQIYDQLVEENQEKLLNYLEVNDFSRNLHIE